MAFVEVPHGRRKRHRGGCPRAAYPQDDYLPETGGAVLVVEATRDSAFAFTVHRKVGVERTNSQVVYARLPDVYLYHYGAAGEFNRDVDLANICALYRLDRQQFEIGILVGSSRPPRHRAGGVERLRQKMKTGVAIMARLLPIMWGTGTTSEAMSRIATPMVSRMISTVIPTLAVIPVICAPVKKFNRAHAASKCRACRCPVGATSKVAPM